MRSDSSASSGSRRRAAAGRGLCALSCGGNDPHIALESVRNNTVVVAEDLGTFGDGMREMLQAFRMFSFRLLYFERYYPDLWFRSPEDYPEMAISAVYDP